MNQALSGNARCFFLGGTKKVRKMRVIGLQRSAGLEIKETKGLQRPS
jgi:hypothetical protein